MMVMRWECVGEDRRRAMAVERPQMPAPMMRMLRGSGAGVGLVVPLVAVAFSAAAVGGAAAAVVVELGSGLRRVERNWRERVG